MENNPNQNSNTNPNDPPNSQAHMISAHPTPNPVHSSVPHHPNPPDPNGLPPINNKSKMKYLIIGFVVIILILLISAGAFLFLNSNNSSKISPASPTPTTKGVACTLEAKICPDGSSVGRHGPNCEFAACPTSSSSAKLETFTSAKFPNTSLKGYTLSYPASWTQSEERDTQSGVSDVTFTKDGYSLRIYQAPMGGGGCLFEGEMPAGPFTDYRNSKTTDIVTFFGKLRKAEDIKNSETIYNYCQESSGGENSYGTITTIGAISAKAPASVDPKIISEIDEIIKSAKTN